LHIYAIAAGIPGLTEARLGVAVERVGEEFALDSKTRWQASSRAGAVKAAGVHHSPERCGPRRYVARSASKLTWFDGLPVSSDGSFLGSDAAALSERWDSVAERLEGQFSVASIDLEAERAEVILDCLAFVPVYCAARDGGVLISNSVALISSVLELHDPDPLGISSFLSLGWAAGDRVLTRGVRLLCGGARHTLEGTGTIRTERFFGPETIPVQTRERRSAGELAGQLTDITRNAVHPVERVGCAITAGHDSRILVGLLGAAGEDALYFTGGVASNPDVVIASEIVERLGLRHEVVSHDPASSSFDWTDAAARFVSQNDGLSSLLQLGDYIDPWSSVLPLGVKLGGMGGEIGRAGTGELTAAATNVPLLRQSLRAQRKLLSMKCRNEGDVMTAQTGELVFNYMDEFCDARLAEGWPVAQLLEAFYTFERIGRWGATGTRRVSATDDGFSPLCLRPFIEYCFSLTPGERYTEAAHYRLLNELSPTLLNHRFEFPLPPQRPRLAPAMATRQLAVALAERLPLRRQGASPEPAGEPAPVYASYPFQHAWFEQRLELMRELFSVADSELWDYISRPRIEGLLNGTEAERARDQEPLLRAATVFWHFHGPRATGRPLPSTSTTADAP
jgi:asparagine synthase (glutamine-hydrolysing)